MFRSCTTGWLAATGARPNLEPWIMATGTFAVACAIRGGKFVKLGRKLQARRSSAEHPIATKAPRCTATAWMLTVAESFA